MTDDAKLIERLRVMARIDTLDTERISSQAASRIEALTAERDAAYKRGLDDAAKVAEEAHYATALGWTPYAIATAIRCLKDKTDAE